VGIAVTDDFEVFFDTAEATRKSRISGAIRE
jgi:hypothetical protein